MLAELDADVRGQQQQPLLRLEDRQAVVAARLVHNASRLRATGRPGARPAGKSQQRRQISSRATACLPRLQQARPGPACYSR
jgi:hypothetical protein